MCRRRKRIMQVNFPQGLLRKCSNDALPSSAHPMPSTNNNGFCMAPVRLLSVIGVHTGFRRYGAEYITRKLHKSKTLGGIAIFLMVSGNPFVFACSGKTALLKFAGIRIRDIPDGFLLPASNLMHPKKSRPGGFVNNTGSGFARFRRMKRLSHLKSPEIALRLRDNMCLKS